MCNSLCIEAQESLAAKKGCRGVGIGFTTKMLDTAITLYYNSVMRSRFLPLRCDRPMLLNNSRQSCGLYPHQTAPGGSRFVSVVRKGYSHE